MKGSASGLGVREGVKELLGLRPEQWEGWDGPLPFAGMGGRVPRSSFSGRTSGSQLVESKMTITYAHQHVCSPTSLRHNILNYLFLTFKCFIYLKEKQRHYRWKAGSPVCWLTHQMPTAAKTGPAWSPASRTGPSSWLEASMWLSHHLLFSGCTIAGL